MLRRIGIMAVLALGISVPTFGQTRATYVLSNGEKHNGVIVYGRGDNNLVDDKYHVNASGQELVFGRDDVVVIDFVGDAPSTAERDAVASAGKGLMFMRDGAVLVGSLHDIRKGDVVQWVNEAGRRDDYPIGAVRRLYLNPAVARNVFLSGSASTAAQTRTTQIGGRQATVVRVEGNQQWADTGIDVRRGDRLSINASGQVEFAPGARSNPAGASGGRRADVRPSPNPNYPVANLGAGALVARIGNGAPFAIGSANQVTMPNDGRLHLGINDDNVGDNSGFFSVTIRQQ